MRRSRLTPWQPAAPGGPLGHLFGDMGIIPALRTCLSPLLTPHLCGHLSPALGVAPLTLSCLPPAPQASGSARTLEGAPWGSGWGWLISTPG